MAGTAGVVAMDGLGLIGTVGFFVPAAILIALVVGAVIRDRRLHARQHEGPAPERAGATDRSRPPDG